MLCCAALLSTLAPAPAASPLLWVGTNGHKAVLWPRQPALEVNRLSVGTNLEALVDVPGASVWRDRSNYIWSTTNDLPRQFYRVEQRLLGSNALLSANVLNRLAYGPTPDDLERLAQIGPQAYIDEQLAPETVPENGDTYTTVVTNGVGGGPLTNWTQVSVVGRATGNTRSNVHIYLTGVGDAYLDNVRLEYQITQYVTNLVDTNVVITTNIFWSQNLVAGGDFEGTLTPPWTPSANLTGSHIRTNVAASGRGSLRLVATAPGTGGGSSLLQTVAPLMPEGALARISFQYLPGPHSGKITIRLGGSGTVATGAEPAIGPTWIYATATGSATATPTIYIYLDGAGEVYLDDLKLVRGTVAGAGANLLVNGDFELPLTNGWRFTENFTNSLLSTNVSFSGQSSLRLIATAAGAGNGNSVFQPNIAGLSNNQTYTLSFWYRPPTRGRLLTARLSGSLLQATPETTLGSLRRRLETFGTLTPLNDGRVTIDTIGGASLNDLRAWFCMSAVGSKRQLLEVLLQFFENHFVTEHAKSRDYFDRYYDDGNLIPRLATDWEYREISRWRAALMNPACTFHDLLVISAESPAMIVYLDTVDSRGNGSNIANENYARELFELFCMGVDNGYDQTDIVQMSRVWTGWSVEQVAWADKFNPFALPTTQYGFSPGAGFNAASNRVGAWTFNYKSGNHSGVNKYVFYNWDATGTNRLGSKILPARFGAPWAGRPYSLILTNNTGTNGIRDGYQSLAHLANLPFTMEFLCVKLCRLFVHDDFVHGVYDYTDPTRSPEADLVHRCMMAWDSGAPKGQLRAVLRTIFESELFRSHGGSLQKVKTPLELVISTVRALRAARANSSFTATTDGFAFVNPLDRMGRMRLFDRAEPDGYPEAGPPWISSGTLTERIRFVQSALIAVGQTGETDAGNNNTDPVGLLQLKLPSTLWREAGAVVDYFLSILYPGEGQANLEEYRQAAIDFLNDGSADTPPNRTPFASLAVSGTAGSAYDTRVRGMVAFLMTLPRFQEQ